MKALNQLQTKINNHGRFKETPGAEAAINQEGTAEIKDQRAAKAEKSDR